MIMLILETMLLLGGAIAAGVALGYVIRRRRAYATPIDSAPPSLLEAQIPGPERDPTLPAYVDHEDHASMAAWQKAQEEIETSW